MSSNPFAGPVDLLPTLAAEVPLVDQPVPIAGAAAMPSTFTRSPFQHPTLRGEKCGSQQSLAVWS